MLEQSKLLNSVSGLKHGFSLRSGGVSQGAYDSLNLGFNTEDDAAAVQENLMRFRSYTGLTNEIFEVQQVHGTAIVNYDNQANRSIEADAIISVSNEVPVGVRTADCVPLLIVHCDPNSKGRANMVAAVHAGWRGTVHGIAKKALNQLVSMGAHLPFIKIAIGPCIGFDNFEVGSEVIEAAQESLQSSDLPYCEKPNGKYLLDLRALIVLQLLSVGIAESSIDLVGGCTYSEPEKYFSYRRDHGKSGRHLSFVCLSTS